MREILQDEKENKKFEIVDIQFADNQQDLESLCHLNKLYEEYMLAVKKLNSFDQSKHHDEVNRRTKLE